jgi:hypothetical protein
MLNTNLGEPRKARHWGTRETIEGLGDSAKLSNSQAPWPIPRQSIQWGSRGWTLTHHAADGAAG